MQQLLSILLTLLLSSSMACSVFSLTAHAEETHEGHHQEQQQEETFCATCVETLLTDAPVSLGVVLLPACYFRTLAYPQALSWKEKTTSLWPPVIAETGPPSFIKTTRLRL